MKSTVSRNKRKINQGLSATSLSCLSKRKERTRRNLKQRRVVRMRSRSSLRLKRRAKSRNLRNKITCHTSECTPLTRLKTRCSKFKRMVATMI